MTGYHTAQKAMLLQFLSEHKDRAFTVEEVAQALQARTADAPAKSTLYRLMQRLVEEHAVKRLVRGNSRSFVYQLVSDEHCHFHLHLKCSQCGKFLHLDEGLSREMREKVRAAASFFVSNEDTVFFGLCADCAPAEAGGRV